MISPPMFIFGIVVGNEAEVEKCIEINKPVDNIFYFITEVLIAMNEVATFKITEHLCQNAPFNVGHFHNLLSSKSFAMSRQCLNDTDVAVGICKCRII